MSTPLPSLTDVVNTIFDLYGTYGHDIAIALLKSRTNPADPQPQRDIDAASSKLLGLQELVDRLNLQPAIESMRQPHA